MALMVNDNKKIYEKPDSGSFVGVIADIVDLGPVGTKFGIKNKVRVVWVLGKADGSGYANDSEGNPFRVMSSVNATMNEKSDLFKLVRSVLGAAPPVPYDVELLIGKSNMLFVVREADATDPKKEYANVKGIVALPANVPALAIPATFVRNKDKKDTRGAAPVSNISANLTGTAAVGQAPAAPAAPVAAATGPAPVATGVATPVAEVVLDKAF